MSARAAKCLEPQHGSHDAFDRPEVRFDDVVEVFDLAHLDVRTAGGTNALNGCRVRATLVDSDLFGRAEQIDGALQKAPRGYAVPFGAKKALLEGENLPAALRLETDIVVRVSLQRIGPPC